MRVFHHLLYLYLLILLINGQAEEDEDEDESNSEISSFLAIWTVTFVGFLSLFVLKLISERLSARRLEDYPDCGTREEGIVEPELCEFDCTWTPSTARIETVRSVVFGGNMADVNVVIEPRMVPNDYRCLDDCPVNTPGSSYDPLLAVCLACGLCAVDCYLLSYARPVETSNTTQSTDASLFFTPQDPREELFAYCIAEQLPSGTTDSSTFGSSLCSTPTTNSEACASLLGYSFVAGKRKRSVDWYDVGNETLTGRIDHSDQFSTWKQDQSDQFSTWNQDRRGKRSIESARPADFSLAYEKSKTPWLCSLKTAGFRGRHRCGVTILSGPPRETILVSAAHCNEICKDANTGTILEICCCRDPSEDGSCREKSSYCGTNPRVTLAAPGDLQIACGEFTLEVVPEGFTPESEVILDVTKITQHPGYQSANPLGGFDIAVYEVSNPERLQDAINQKTIFPACLPRKQDDYIVAPGRLTAWIDAEPTFRAPPQTLDDYVFKNFIPKQRAFSYQNECADPDWMGSNTFYPQGTVCYRDLSEKDCVTFGNSGSPLVRQFQDGGTARFSFVGPLSISKGCDRTTINEIFQNRYKTTVPQFFSRAENPAVFTDAYCYLDWIAEQYGLKTPADWVKPDSCTNGGVGDINDRDKENCRTSRGTECAFTDGFDSCKIQAFEGYAYNIFFCQDTEGILSNCANNCKGVDPNSIVIGGAAVAVAGAVAGSALIGPVLGTGAIGAVGFGALMINRGCPPGFCRPTGSETCCPLIVRRGILRCPRSC